MTDKELDLILSDTLFPFEPQYIEFIKEYVKQHERHPSWKNWLEWKIDHHRVGEDIKLSEYEVNLIMNLLDNDKEKFDEIMDMFCVETDE